MFELLVGLWYLENFSEKMVGWANFMEICSINILGVTTPQVLKNTPESYKITPQKKSAVFYSTLYY